MTFGHALLDFLVVLLVAYLVARGVYRVRAIVRALRARKQQQQELDALTMKWIQQKFVKQLEGELQFTKYARPTQKKRGWPWS